jgi:hypothetical protein
VFSFLEPAVVARGIAPSLADFLIAFREGFLRAIESIVVSKAVDLNLMSLWKGQICGRVQLEGRLFQLNVLVCFVRLKGGERKLQDRQPVALIEQYIKTH